MTVAAFLLLAACRGPTSEEGVFFPTADSQDWPAAIVGGTLVREGMCLFAEAEGERYLVIWREGYAFRDGELLDRDGNRVVALGQDFLGGGGFTSLEAAERLVTLPIPDACRTQEYMLADEIRLT